MRWKPILKQFDKIKIYIALCKARATDIYLSYRTLPVEKINMENTLFEIRFSLYRLQIKRYWALFAKNHFITNVRINLERKRTFCQKINVWKKLIKIIYRFEKLDTVSTISNQIRHNREKIRLISRKLRKTVHYRQNANFIRCQR